MTTRRRRRRTAAVHITSDLVAWRTDARCRLADPAIFFHPDGERGAARRQRQQAAKLVCEDCPVKSQCRDYSLKVGEPFGTWGGLTEEERGKLLSMHLVNLRTDRAHAHAVARRAGESGG